jgi:hypothetical protein
VFSIAVRTFWLEIFSEKAPATIACDNQAYSL